MTLGTPTGDNQAQAALARLTDKEKDCLRRRLQHQTAKEMALDLGISPHAVEKRLKMARMKLGVGSSLDAARMLEAWEQGEQRDEQGYGQTAAHPSDLSPEVDAADKGAIDAAPLPETANGDKGRRFKLVSGALVMSIIAAAILAIAVQSADKSDFEIQEEFQPVSTASMDDFEIEEGFDPETASPSPYDGKDYDENINYGIKDFKRVPASPERVAKYLEQMFNVQDADGSGFIEKHEAPIQMQIGKPIIVESPEDIPSGYSYSRDDVLEVLEGGEAQERYISNVDKNDDGKVSLAEFSKPMAPQFEEFGIPLLPADWETQQWSDGA